jgi:hypothetical protein
LGGAALQCSNNRLVSRRHADYRPWIFWISPASSKSFFVRAPGLCVDKSLIDSSPALSAPFGFLVLHSTSTFHRHHTQKKGSILTSFSEARNSILATRRVLTERELVQKLQTISANIFSDLESDDG